MGNTVSAAEMAATQIVHPNTPVHDHSKFAQYGKDIPPECPMHKKLSASECPINPGNSDLDPLNMVRIW